MSIFKIIHIDENENRSSEHLYKKKLCYEYDFIYSKNADRIESF